MAILLGATAIAWGATAIARAEEERPPPSTWHATAFVRGSMGIRVIDYWSKGSDMVARTLIAGHPITTIISGGRYIVYDGLTRKGLALERSPRARAEDRRRPRPFAFEFEEIVRDGGERVEQVALGRSRGEVWQIRDARGRRKVWVTTSPPRVPLRLETFDRATSETVELDYQNWIFDMELSRDFFSAPRGVELERLDYTDFLERAARGPVGQVPILYPDLLHGTPPD